ncbi:hypothetical protein AXG93_2587s1750 [Marchantia polymorpha subsp. ruderalis]|uniref:Beta-hexosaminidase n=1 Tax=Marchantia polymorpha subsp. ruderalis TaxID=1480154 RepID=A0A176WQS5_MARPO|nr:hypothetical protein AXG93_2587s1750 [Marchantia polymorpha subsp. ruderalis]
MVTLWRVVVILLVAAANLEVEVWGFRPKTVQPLYRSTGKWKARHAHRVEKDQTWIWPLPAEWSKGESTLLVDSQLELVVRGALNQSHVLEESFERYIAHIFVHLTEKDVVSKIKRRKWGGETLQKLVVNVVSDDETLQLGTDESYTLQVPAEGKTSEAYLELTRVRQIDKKSSVLFSAGCNGIWGVAGPGDTSRHYLPVETIKKIIDSMAFAKLNVLHWHIVDTQSFPLEIPSYPDLWKGAYSKAERYTMDDARNIVEYARRRGINIMPELDSPGHAASWGVGYPKLWPSRDCQQPLDISSKLTFEVIAGILADFRNVFPFKLMHLGGDEVDTSCWNNTPHVNDWLEKRNLSAHDGYASFVLEVQKLAIALDWAPVNWEEPFNEFGNLLHPDTVVHEWLSNDLVPKIIATGRQCIVSNQDVWYLDHLDVPWELFYLNEPLTDLNSAEQQRLVIGGEVCMWGETADPSDIEATIWPRAAAAAERLWSPVHSANSTATARARLSRFRCLLNERGVGAGPVRNYYAREGPYEPGSCYDQ